MVEYPRTNPAVENEDQIPQDTTRVVNSEETSSHTPAQGTAPDGTGKDSLIGPYQIIRKMGEGGMGAVYLGVRADKEFTRHVAIKVIRKGMDSHEIVARFRRERQILASLDHPNIAKLLDGGSSQEGLPYFVMEYVQGKPLTEYCDSHKLTVRERLELFRNVCSAVQYAHQNLVVHRDLKPANILVGSDGSVKLLDFGIAKFLNADVYSSGLAPTATEMRVMTPDYASPEQARGDPITTATDVYSLGVLLYELLSGQRPYRFTNRSQLEIYRVINEEEPARPSTALTRHRTPNTDRVSSLRGQTTDKLQKQLQGDLDNIILMALRKEPQRRYQSVEAFSEDIGRYIDGHPVAARKGTLRYRAGKYIQRHRIGVATAAAVFILLSAFTLLLAIQNIKISRQNGEIMRERDAAVKSEQKAQKVTDFLAKLFEVNDPAQSRGENLTARQILDRGSERIQREFNDQPDVKADLLDRVGMIYVTLGTYGKAETMVRQSLSIRQSLYGSENLKIAVSLRDLGVVLWKQGQYKEAEKLLRSALAMDRKLSGNEALNVSEDLADLAYVLDAKGQLDEAEELWREALAMDRNLQGNEPNVVIDLANLAVVLREKGQLDEAEKLYREALSLDRKLYGNEHPNVATDQASLAVVLREKDDLDEAEKVNREALALHRKLLGSEHPQVAIDLALLGAVLLRKGELDEAETLTREALAIQRNLLGNEHSVVAGSLVSLANILQAKGKTLDAIASAKEVLAMPEDKLPADHKYRARAKSVLGAALASQSKYAQAEPLLLEAYRVQLDRDKGGLYTTNLTLQRIVSLYMAWGKPEKAAEYRKLTQTAQ